MKLTSAHARLAAELTVNLILPWLAYRIAAAHTTEFAATAWSAAPPTLWSLLELALHRRIDALSIMVLAGIALSLAALLFGGSPRMLLVRENLFTIPIGMAFLVSLATKRPLIYYAARAVMRRQDDFDAARFEASWQRPAVIRGVRRLSLVWGVGLVAQGVLLGWMAWSWKTETYLILSPVIGYGMLALLGLWSWRYGKTMGQTMEMTRPATAPRSSPAHAAPRD